MGFVGGLVIGSPLFLCFYYIIVFRPRQHISYKISWFRSNMFITCKLYILLYRDYQKSFVMFPGLLQAVNISGWYVLRCLWSLEGLYILVFRDCISSGIISEGSLYISVGDYLGRCQAVSVPIVSGSGGCHRSGFLWLLQAVGLLQVSESLPGFYAVSASSAVGAGGFRDNAVRGVQIQKHLSKIRCFLPLSVVPVAWSPINVIQFLKSAALIALYINAFQLWYYSGVGICSVRSQPGYYLGAVSVCRSGMISGCSRTGSGVPGGFCRFCGQVANFSRVDVRFSRSFRGLPACRVRTPIDKLDWLWYNRVNIVS